MHELSPEMLYEIVNLWPLKVKGWQFHKHFKAQFMHLSQTQLFQRLSELAFNRWQSQLFAYFWNTPHRKEFPRKPPRNVQIYFLQWKAKFISQTVYRLILQFTLAICLTVRKFSIDEKLFQKQFGAFWAFRVLSAPIMGFADSFPPPTWSSSLLHRSINYASLRN